MNYTKSSLLLAGLVLNAYVYASTSILSITPSITNTTLRTDSETSILYTVTNNTNKPINNLTITPNYHTTGVASNIFLNSLINTCTTLIPGASCNFSITIQGSNQPASFQVLPRVCGYNKLFCNTPLASAYLTVSMNTINRTAYAYYSINSGANNNRLVPVNGDTFAVGSPAPIAGGETIQTPIAVSTDGTTVFAAQQDGGGNVDLLIFTAGPTPILTQSVTLGYLPYFDVIVPTPDGKTIYASASEASGLYRIDNANGSYFVTWIALPAGDDASGMAISPDGSRLFIGSYDLAQLSIMDTSTNQVIQILTNSDGSCEFDAPGAIAVTPNGSTIYVANGFGAEGISVVLKNGDGSYSCGSRITDPTQQLSSMVLSADGHYLYALGFNSPQQLYVIDATTNLSLGTSYTVPDGSTGIAITPDGNHLFISNIHSAYVFPLSNGLPSSLTPNAIDVGGGSQTNGNFVG